MSAAKAAATRPAKQRKSAPAQLPARHPNEQPPALPAWWWWSQSA